MKFKKITLFNFRQFKGEVEIEFSTDETRNLTIVHAMNGAGKTTLLQAFRWCLYGDVRLPSRREVLNSQVFMNLAEGESEDVVISIMIENNNRNYVVTRTQTVTKKANQPSLAKSKVKVMHQDYVGQAKIVEDQHEVMEIIEGILSSSLAEYVFFDGERIQNLGLNNQEARKEMQKAIYTIFNITIYEKMLKRLDQRVRKNIALKINLTDEVATMHTEKRALIDQLELEYAELKTKRTEAELNRETVKVNLKEISSKIAMHKQAQSLEVTLQKNKQQLEANRQEIMVLVGLEKQKNRKKIQENYTKYLVNSLFSQHYAALETEIKAYQSRKIELKSLIPKDLVTQILAEGACLCGTDITQELRANLMELEANLPYFNISTQVNLWNEKSQAKIQETESLAGQKANDFERLLSLEKQNSELNTENKAIEKELSKLPETIDLTKQRETFEERKACLDELIANHTVRMEDNLKLRKDIENEIVKLAKSKSVNNLGVKKIELLDQIIKVNNEKITELKRNVHTGLQKAVNDIFSDIAHKGSKTIEINPDTYSYQINDKLTGSQALSEGESVIASLSFIAAIIEVAKKQNSNNGLREFPLVLDAPFAKLDSLHLKKVALTLPAIADQVILFTVDQQFEGEAKKVMVDKIGKQYNLINTEDRQAKAIEIH